MEHVWQYKLATGNLKFLFFNIHTSYLANGYKH